MAGWQQSGSLTDLTGAGRQRRVTVPYLTSHGCRVVRMEGAICINSNRLSIRRPAGGLYIGLMLLPAFRQVDRLEDTGVGVGGGAGSILRRGLEKQTYQSRQSTFD
jgi:hypothetical protein